MNMFPTGATGFLGRNVLRELLARGHRVWALFRDIGHRDQTVLHYLELRCTGGRRAPTGLVTQNWSNSAHGFAKSFGCLAGNHQFHISASGEFMPCNFTPISFGNVRQYPIDQLWKKLIGHPAWRRLRNDCRMQSPDFRGRYIAISIPCRRESNCRRRLKCWTG